MESGRELAGKLSGERELRGHKRLIAAFGGPWVGSATSEFVNSFSFFGPRRTVLFG